MLIQKLKILSFILGFFLITKFIFPQAEPVLDQASDIKTSTTNFDNNLSSADSDIQKALDTLDNLGISGGGAPTNATYLTSTSNATLTNEVDLGLLSTGLLKGTVAAGVSTISAITDSSADWNTAYTDRLKWDGGATGLTAATGRTSLGLVIGTDVQAYNANLLSLAGLSYVSASFVKMTGANTFSLDTLTYLTTVDISSNTNLAVTAPIVLTGDSLSITQSATAANGYLSSTDWNTFNGKQATISVSTPITLTGTSIGMVNQGTTTTVLHGNAAGNPSFGAVVSADITDATITYADIQNISASSRVLGRITALAGVTEELTGANIKTIIGDVALTTDTSGNYVASVADGTGIDGTTSAEGATYTPTLDLTEINSATFGSGTFTTLTFDAGVTDPVWTYSSGIANLSTGALQVGGTAVLTAEVDGSITNELPIAGTYIDISGSPASTVDVDLTETESVTWGAGAAATIVHTYNVSGTDTTMTMGSAATTFSGVLTVSGAGNSSFTGNVGIGTTAPYSLLDASSTIGGVLTLSRNDTSVTAADTLGTIDFWSNDTQTTTNPLAAQIIVTAKNTIATDINPGVIKFYTTPVGVATSPTLVLTLDETQGATFANTVNATTFVGALTGTASGNLVSGGDAGTPSAIVLTHASGTVTSLTLVTPALGTPASGVLTSCTGLPYSGLANGTDGNLITWDANGAPALVATGDATQVLTSNGAGTAPTFQAAAGGAATSLNNLASVAINTSLLSDADNTDDLGSTTKTWANTYTTNVLVNDGTVGTSGVGVVTVKKGTTPSTSPTSCVQLYSDWGYAYNTTNVLTGSTTTEDDCYSSTYNAAKTIDGNTATMWWANTNLPHWAKYQLSAAKVVTKITITADTGGNYTDTPKDFTFAGSNNDSDYTTLLTVTNQTGWTAGSSNTWTFANTTGYLYYKINVTKVQSGDVTNVSIGEIAANENKLDLFARDVNGNLTNITGSCFSSNVGIGTTNPLYTLHVVGAGTTTGIGLTITNSTPTTTFSIRDDGILTIPLQSGARVRLGTQQDNIANSTPTKILLDSEDYDIQGEFATNKFTAKVAGKYLVCGGVRWAAGTVIASKLHATMIYYNGAVMATAWYHSTTTDTLSIPVTTVIHLAVNDYVELYAYHEEGASTVDVNASTDTFLSVNKIN